ncbi:Octapeptide-repeat protein T2, partial [Ophiophagus hannah]
MCLGPSDSYPWPCRLAFPQPFTLANELLSIRLWLSPFTETPFVPGLWLHGIVRLLPIGWQTEAMVLLPASMQYLGSCGVTGEMRQPNGRGSQLQTLVRVRKEGEGERERDCVLAPAPWKAASSSHLPSQLLSSLVLSLPNVTACLDVFSLITPLAAFSAAKIPLSDPASVTLNGQLVAGRWQVNGEKRAKKLCSCICCCDFLPGCHVHTGPSSAAAMRPAGFGWKGKAGEVLGSKEEGKGEWEGRGGREREKERKTEREKERERRERQERKERRKEGNKRNKEGKKEKGKKEKRKKGRKRKEEKG